MNDLFRKPEKSAENTDEKKEIKGPQNIFSKPINVMQTEEARKSRLKIAIIEGLLFSMFLTAITAIYTISGLDVKINPEDSINTPSVLFYIVEFVVFSILACVGNYFLTEKRVNDYNQKVAGVTFDIDKEIEKALSEQEADGILAEDVAALNKSNGVEVLNFEISDASSSENPFDKVFCAKNNEKDAGKITTCKANLLDSMGVLQTVLKVSTLNIEEEFLGKGLPAKLFTALKEGAMADGFSIILVPKAISDEHTLNLNPLENKSAKLADDEGNEISDSEALCLCELYPGALQ